METMFDYISNLPYWIQFTLILVWLIGSGGGILSIIVGYFRSVNDTHHKERLETIENAQTRIQNEQIKIQSEAHTAAADRQNTLKLIEVIGATNERWQNVVDAISERKHVDETRLITVLDKLDATIDRNSQSVDELAGGLAGQIGTVAQDIHSFSEDNKQTEQYIRTTIETTNRNIDSVLGATVTIRDRIIPMIDSLEKRLDKLDNCADMLLVLEQIKAILSKPSGVTQPIPEISEPTLPENTEDNAA